MAILKCKMCGGNLEVSEEMTVCECEYCGTRQTVPVVDDEKKIKLFERANKLRSNCEFDKAAGVYENIIADYTEEAEGYWGLILCRYGIEYVDDPATGKKIPTCHRSSFDSIMDDEDFELVMENSDSVSRAVYREEAKYIEEIRKGIIEVSGKEEPYDIFICYKETDENGERTLDSVLAQDVYEALTQKGYRVFFSRITLEDKLGVEYEPYIFAALNSAKIMLAFGTSYDHYNAVWVKNEWSRYLKLMAKDKTKHLIPCFKNVDAYDIPKEFVRLQSQDMGKIGAIQDLMRGIDKLIAPESIVEKSPAKEQMVPNFTGTSGNAVLKRGFMAIEDNEWNRATEFFEQALNINAEDGQAYWGEVLAGHKCRNAIELADRLCEELINEISEETLTAEIEDRYPVFSEKYFFIEIFTKKEIETLFRRKFTYKSKVSGIKCIVENNKNSFVLNSNKLYQRAVRYANGSTNREIVKLKETMEKCFISALKKAEEAEATALKAAISNAEAYFAKLEQALQTANQLALQNSQKNEAKYETEHAAWLQEKDAFTGEHKAWEQEMIKYQEAYAVWQETQEAVCRKWNIAKSKYAKDKKMCEREVQRLEMEKNEIEGFLAETRIAVKQKEIYAARQKLRNLVIPEEPAISEAPTRPSEPILRDEPKISLEEKIGKEEVLQVFHQMMA